MLLFEDNKLPSVNTNFRSVKPQVKMSNKYF